MMEVKEDAFYTLSEINEGLGVTLYTLRWWVRSGRLNAGKLGNRYYVNGGDLKVFLSRGTRGPREKKEVGFNESRRGK